jgi:vacuolar-type H+-ATPase catalytic subunit A/Vma1
MKKLLITIIIAVFTLQLSAQTEAYSVVEFKAKPHTQKKLMEILFHWSELEMEEPTEQPTVWYGLGPWERI